VLTYVLYFSGSVILIVELGDWTCTVVQRWQFVGFKHCISTVSHFAYLIVMVSPKWQAHIYMPQA